MNTEKPKKPDNSKFPIAMRHAFAAVGLNKGDIIQSPTGVKMKVDDSWIVKGESKITPGKYFVAGVQYVLWVPYVWTFKDGKLKSIKKKKE
jgi:hypothetical protein